MVSTAVDRINGARSSLAIKAPCAAATTAAITLSGEQTIDAIACVTGNRVLVQDQASSVDNGIYICDTSTWARAPDFDGTADVATGTMVYVVGGATNGNKFFQVTTTGTIIPDTSNIDFTAVSIAFGSPTANSITYAMVQQVAANSILCNNTASAADVQATALAINQLMGRGASGNLDAISLGTGLTMTGTTLSASAASGLTAGALSFVGMWNGTIVASRSGNAETIAIKTYAGADPSAGDPVTFIFRNVTAGTGDYVFLQATAALSVTISSGSTMGMTNSVLSRLWLTVFNDASTLRLGVVNCVSGNNIMSLRDDLLLSSTAEGGAGAADSAQVIYTGTAVTTKAMRVLGYLEYTLATVGTWGTAPSKIQLFGPGIPLPATPVQIVYGQTASYATGSTAIPVDDSIPQSGEGDQYMTLSITPTSACNQLYHEIEFVAGHVSSNSHTIALFQDATANALVASIGGISAANEMVSSSMTYMMPAGTAASTTFKVRAGNPTAVAVYFNAQSAAGRRLGGVMDSSMRITELMR